MNNGIERYMTPSPHTIGKAQTVAFAHRIMRAQGIRHLPVLDGGELLGIVSERDLHLIETLRDVDPETVPVSEAMSQDVFMVGRTATLRDVAREMAEHKYGSAVVMEHGHTVGVFTTVDALRALASLS